MKCRECKYWFKDENMISTPLYGSCRHPEIHDMIVVGYSDDWGFNENFGCILFEKKE